MNTPKQPKCQRTRTILIDAFVQKRFAFNPDMSLIHISASTIVEGIPPVSIFVDNDLESAARLLEFVAKLRSALPDHKFILTKTAKAIVWVPCILLNPRKKNK